MQKLYLSRMSYLQNLGLATIACDGSLGSPGPALLTGTTLNSYSLPSSKRGTVAFSLSPGTSSAFSQGPPFSFFSTM